MTNSQYYSRAIGKKIIYVLFYISTSNKRIPKQDIVLSRFFFNIGAVVTGDRKRRRVLLEISLHWHENLKSPYQNVLYSLIHRRASFF